jgi:hypothetical protein
VVRGEEGLDISAENSLEDDDGWATETTETGEAGESEESAAEPVQRRRRYVPPSAVGFSFFIRGPEARIEVRVSAVVRYCDSCTALLPRLIRDRITVLDEFSLRSFPPEKVSYAEIAAFKGLENEAIVLVDVPPAGEASIDRCLLDVGMSRARAVLSIIRMNP